MASIRSGIGENMEDRYLFKAKRIDNDEWEIGSLIALPTGEYEISNKCNNPPDCDHIWNKVVITHKVDPSTICQCTGLKDKNGKLIWENDIVNATDVNFVCVDGIVVKVTDYNLMLNLYYSDELERVGNKFDNPELLRK